MKKLLLSQAIVSPMISIFVGACGTMPLPQMTQQELVVAKPQPSLVVPALQSLPQFESVIAVENASSQLVKDIEAEEAMPVEPAKEQSVSVLWQQAMDSLQFGHEDEARQALSAILRQQSEHLLANKMMTLLDTKVQSLGENFVDYRLKRGDSLSSLAKQHLGDPLKFVLLARYNQIEIPNSIRIGQWIRLPSSINSRHLSVKENYNDGLDALHGGHYGEAFVFFNKVLMEDPKHQSAQMQIKKLRGDIANSLYRGAVEAQRTQNLDLAISQWNEYLVIRPENALAKLYREKAMKLKNNLAKFIH